MSMDASDFSWYIVFAVGVGCLVVAAVLVPVFLRMRRRGSPMAREECPQCHQKIDAHDVFCGACGYKLSVAEK